MISSEEVFENESRLIRETSVLTDHPPKVVYKGYHLVDVLN